MTVKISCLSRLYVSLLAFAGIFALCFMPGGHAYAMNSSEVREEFSSSEISRLFERVDDEDDSEFVLYDYEAEETSYLKVRSAYRSRYDELVGADGVDPIREKDPKTEIDGYNLVQVADPSSTPWCNVLYLGIWHNDCTIGNGSAFMVADCVAISAAHVVYGDGHFYSDIGAVSGYINVGSTSQKSDVKYSIVPTKYVESAGEGVIDADKNYDQDYAVLVFAQNPKGVDDCTFFDYESISVLDSWGLSINNAGYTRLTAQEDFHLYTNDEWGSISVWDPHPLGNSFRMDLSLVGGMSGGPVFCRGNDGSFVAVGINSYESYKTDSNGNVLFPMNFGCRITERLQVLVAWGSAYGFAHIAPEPVNPSSPSTGVEDLTAEEIADQIMAQYTQQSIPLERVETAFSYAKAANPEVAAWLYVPGTNVSLPVCRHEGDDSYYLDHDSRRHDSALGAAYMEEADSAAFDQALTVLYGHSFTKLPLMFTGLHAFEDESFFREHEYIYVLTDVGWLAYRVVEAAYYTGGHIAGMADESDAASVQAYFDAFADDDPEGFIGFRRPCELDAGTDHVLQLSTCTVPATDGARFVVSAALVGQ